MLRLTTFRFCSRIWQNHLCYPDAILNVIGRLRMVALNNETRLCTCWTMIPRSSNPRAGFSIPRVGRSKPSRIRLHFWSTPRCIVPTLAVIDILMPDMNGLEVQTRLRRVSPSTRVIVLTAKDDPSVRRMAMNAGASAFFIKGVQSGEFLAGVKAAQRIPAISFYSRQRGM